jgi:hypothetical protein
MYKGGMKSSGTVFTPSVVKNDRVSSYWERQIYRHLHGYTLSSWTFLEYVISRSAVLHNFFQLTDFLYGFFSLSTSSTSAALRTGCIRTVLYKCVGIMGLV